MSNMKKIVTVATTLLFCLGTQSVLAQSQQRDHQRDHERSAMQELNLSDSQKEAIQAIRQQAKQDRSLFRGERDEEQKLMRQNKQISSWDAATARSLVESKITNRQAHQLANAQNRQAVFAVLTADQQQTLIANQAARHADRDPLKRQQQRLEKLLRMANKVDATEAQLAQLTSIHNDATAAMQSYHNTVMTQKMAERSLIQVAEFDTGAWQTLQDEFAPTAIEIGVLRAKTKFDIQQVFNPKQQKKLRKMKQRTEKRNKKGHKGYKGEKGERKERMQQG
jgi:Spy/CpxP family protein refolding chaperone